MRKLIVLAALALAFASSVGAQQIVKSPNLKFGKDAPNAVDGAAVWQEVEDAVCSNFGYTPMVPVLDGNGKPTLDAQGHAVMQANPEGRAAFVRRQIKRWLLAQRDAYLTELDKESYLAAAAATRKPEPETP
jgi:hypothetical protein